jgi:DNA-binding transcriptional regulator YdaS (Cro superfamily)
MPDEMIHIADRVRGVAAEKRANQQTIADILGMSRGSVNQRMTGNIPFAAWEIGRLAHAFDVPVSAFYSVRAA